MTKAQQKRLANKKAKLRKQNKEYKLDNQRGMDFVLCTIIGLIFMVAVTYAPIIPESLIKKYSLPGEEITYPNEVESTNIKLPEQVIDTTSADYEDGLIIIIKKDTPSNVTIITNDNNEIKIKVEPKKKLVTKKKVKRFAIIQLIKLMAGIPIIPGS